MYEADIFHQETDLTSIRQENQVIKRVGISQYSVYPLQTAHIDQQRRRAENATNDLSMDCCTVRVVTKQQIRK